MRTEQNLKITVLNMLLGPCSGLTKGWDHRFRVSRHSIAGWQFWQNQLHVLVFLHMSSNERSWPKIWPRNCYALFLLLNRSSEYVTEQNEPNRSVCQLSDLLSYILSLKSNFRYSKNSLFPGESRRRHWRTNNLNATTDHELWITSLSRPGDPRGSCWKTLGV